MTEQASPLARSGDRDFLESTPEPEVLSVDQASALLHVGRNSIYEAIRRGEFPAVRIGKRILIPRVALQRFLLCNAQLRDTGT